MSNTIHIENALGLAELVIAIAQRHHARPLAARLEGERAAVLVHLGRHRALMRDVEARRRARATTHLALSAALGATSAAIVEVLGALDPAVSAGGRHLSVVERVRYRLRRLAALDEDTRRALARVEHELARALVAVDDATDASLEAQAACEGALAQATLGAQALRLSLERTRAELLVGLPPRDPDARALRGLTLRTRRPAWTLTACADPRAPLSLRPRAPEPCAAAA